MPIPVDYQQKKTKKKNNNNTVAPPFTCSYLPTNSTYEILLIFIIQEWKRHPSTPISTRNIIVLNISKSI